MYVVNLIEDVTILKDKINDAGHETYRSSVSRLKNHILNNTYKKSKNRFYIAIKERRAVSGSHYFINRLYKFLDLYKSSEAEVVANQLES